MLPVWHFLEPYSSIVYVHQLCLFQYWVSPCNIWQVQPNNRIKKNQGCSYIYICNKIVFRQRISLHQSPFFARDLELLKRGAPKDQVSFVHPLTDVLVNISTDTQLMYIGRHITWVSTDMSVNISTDSRPKLWPRYVSWCIDQCINRDISSVMVDTSTDYREISWSI